ncbi:hypothetical protein [Rouxiella badensis]|jgi:hypothetical protein|uniref:Uncharacterized protein n=1 Tax=Rouxiella badensis TaxID=1646377 RepID=A0A1X0WAH3_9GAMM|nr:hypothetical protein [Rouxiella badensis]MCC3703616.1 hypothetical protein [Rouxiella badensis]MCC3720579.1 hypothetical protein [Rouxiella badensis]MCC3730418.1 hypothetical protein [Rouxiella badensis]MCC3734464.1 hypothetical protein [Rouxiella badensis]MCC3742746.1 hypothetical protein [Rouxiella badensis]
MKRSWFLHDNLSTDEAEQLILQYHARHIQTRKQLNPDRLSWCVSAYLEERRRRPQSSTRWQSALGRLT